MSEVCCRVPERPWKIHCNTVVCFPGGHGRFPTQNKGIITSLMTLPPLEFMLSLSYWMEIYNFPGTPGLPAFPETKVQYSWHVHSPEGGFSSYILIHRSQSQSFFTAATKCCVHIFTIYLSNGGMFLSMIWCRSGNSILPFDKVTRVQGYNSKK